MQLCAEVNTRPKGPSDELPERTFPRRWPGPAWRGNVTVSNWYRPVCVSHRAACEVLLVLGSWWRHRLPSLTALSCKRNHNVSLKSVSGITLLDSFFTQVAIIFYWMFLYS